MRADAVSGRRAATLARVAVLAAVLDTVAVAGSLPFLDEDLLATLNKTGSWLNLVAAPAFPLLAALMFHSRSPGTQWRDRSARQLRLAWLFLAFGVLCTGTLLVHTLASHALGAGTFGGLALAWVSSWLWTGVPTGILLALLWFPTGEAPGPRWIWVQRGLSFAVAAIWTSIAFVPGRMEDFPGHDNPLGWSAGRVPLAVVSTAGFAALAICAMATFASVGWRFYRGGADLRGQLRWLLIACSVLAATIAAPSPGPLRGLAVVLNVLATVLLPVTLAVTLVRRDGFVPPRLLVYATLSGVLLAAYLVIVGISQALLGSRFDRVGGLVAAGIVAVLAAPLRTRLQRSVDRLVYGERSDPYVALTELGRRIAGSPDDLLQEVVAAVADALRAPYAAVILAGDDTPAATSGRPAEPQMSVPLSLRGNDVGRLVVAHRSSQARYGERDLALLDDLARHIAVAAHAAALTRDLQRSRESLVVAREEERRRIRRDLHDGLGPALAGVAFGIDAVRNTLARDPDAAADALGQLTAEVHASLADVRRLVYDLRPPALDQLGLVPAVQQYAARLTERGVLAVAVESPPMPHLPAAVEVAAYRIATEALTNIARHARAQHGSVRFAVDATVLRLEVLDDGIGPAPHRSPISTGVGLSGMSERAAELGGTCTVGPRRGGGMSVVALLPLRAVT